MAFCLLLPALLLSACRGMELENKTEQVEGYTREEAMIVAANERNRYQNLYGAEIWDADMGEQGTSFSDCMVQNVKSFLEQIMTLNLLAEDRGITLSSQERDALRQLSGQYYQGLTEADLSFIGCSEADVQRMYADYYLAGKTVAALTEGRELDISDSEAKVIHVQQIVTASRKKAMALLKMVKIDGDDFATMARRYSESEETELVLRRGGAENLYEKTAFSLDEGQISNIVEMDGLYYIIKCTDGYDEEATQLRKSRLEEAVLDSAFWENYEPYQSAHTVKFTESFWNRIDLSEGQDSTVTNFFDLYHDAFPDD